MDKVITNPVKVIREKCLECCCGQASEVSLCTIEDCPLWVWRFGKNPYRAKTKREPLTGEKLEAARERLKKANAARLLKSKSGQTANDD